MPDLTEHSQTPSIEVHLGRQGRLVIPAELRRSLGLEAGDRLVVWAEAGRLIVEKPQAIEQRLKSRFAQISTTRSLANELILERRDEAMREAQ